MHRDRRALSLVESDVEASRIGQQELTKAFILNAVSAVSLGHIRKDSCGEQLKAEYKYCRSSVVDSATSSKKSWRPFFAPCNAQEWYLKVFRGRLSERQPSVQCKVKWDKIAVMFEGLPSNVYSISLDFQVTRRVQLVPITVSVGRSVVLRGPISLDTLLV